ncbi:YihY/virulence factor BrkB family protein [Pedobacter sp. KR3-3]|uniref:YihY/virulence factor BrkB family protein n=1 Tax=Pedobacter albus TaxID=3113905 RepID=A0ABU7I6B5_9SPHI|nr:YihY/virulence factor BrkB family protein [Pedobacter sp. KR3-3]MEE1945028.1 YihY/virulence factor BrkB family protein [Pedobacter sp. KR3-3]
MSAITVKRSKLFFKHIKTAFKLFRKNDPLRLAGATAFFANFALPPILLILIRLFGFFVDRKLLARQIFERLASILDDSSTDQIRQTLRNIRGIDHNWWATILSFVFFIFVATTLFNVIKNSMDQIWKIGVNEKIGIMFNLKLRARSMVIILLAGILFFVGLLTDSVQAFIGTYINTAAPTFGKIFLSVLNQALFVVIVTAWFTVLFRFLTNGRPSWKASIRGGILTGILFTLGKFILRIMLPLSNIGNVYGASGSIVLIMLFVFYSSFIFYFGACFVKVLSDAGSKPIKPIKGAFLYEIKEIAKEEGKG